MASYQESQQPQPSYTPVFQEWLSRTEHPMRFEYADEVHHQMSDEEIESLYPTPEVVEDDFQEYVELSGQ